MTTALREAASPQDSYYADARDIFAQLDRLERTSLLRILTRVDELRREVTDSLLSLHPGPDDTWQAWQLRAYQSELERAAARWGARFQAELAQDLQDAADLGRRQMPALTTLAGAEGVPAAMVSFGTLGLLDDQIAVAVMHSANLIRSVEASVVNTVNRQIQQVVFSGQSRSEAVQAIRAALSTQPSRRDRRLGSLTAQAARIEQTELIRVYNLASEYGIRNAEEELPGIMKEWVTVLDSRADPDCRALSGKRVKPGAAFPGGVTAPPLHPNCLVAGTVVAAPQIKLATERWYSGDVIEIRTERGHVLTVTPNHPVLTPQGWIDAGSLTEGRDVLSSAYSEALAARVDPDNYHVPTKIEQILETFRCSGPMASISVPTAAEDFHGDGEGSEVCVIRANGELWGQVETALAQPNVQQHLGGGYPEALALASQGIALHPLTRGLDTAHGGVGGLRILAAFVGGALGNNQSVRIGKRPSLDASPFKSSGDGLPTDGIPLAQALLSLTAEVETDQFGRGTPAFLARTTDGFKSGSERDTQTIKSPENRSGTDAVGQCQTVDRLPGLVAADKVVGVTRMPGWQGQVYNLETSLGWYIASGIITHNCRCRVVSWLPGWPADPFPLGTPHRVATVPA